MTRTDLPPRPRILVIALRRLGMDYDAIPKRFKYKAEGFGMGLGIAIALIMVGVVGQGLYSVLKDIPGVGWRLSH